MGPWQQCPSSLCLSFLVCGTGKGYGISHPTPPSCVVLRICLASLNLVLMCKEVQRAWQGWHSTQAWAPPRAQHSPQLISQFWTPTHQMPVQGPSVLTQAGKGPLTQGEVMSPGGDAPPT